MEMIRVTNNDLQIEKNFNLREFYKAKYPYPPMEKDFDLPKCLPKALQILRDYYSAKFHKEVSWQITCTIRKGEDDFSSHKNCVDSIPTSYTKEILDDLQNEFKNWETSELVRSILKTGTSVLIYENQCLHISWRETNLNSHPDYKAKYGIDKFYIGKWIYSPDKPYGINTCYA